MWLMFRRGGVEEIMCVGVCVGVGGGVCVCGLCSLHITFVLLCLPVNTSWIFH